MTTALRAVNSAPADSGVAAELARGLRPFVGGDLPVRLRAWDGSEAGPADGPLVEIRTPDALRRLLWRPGELGAAQAYVTGEIDVEGDLDAALTHVWDVVRQRGLGGRPGPAAFAAAIGAALRTGAVGRPPAAPASQARVHGRLHSKLRDRAVISHHYDLSNEFYGRILDETMAYSSAYWRKAPGTPGYTLADAQRDKLSLVCRKLGLEPGMTLLDVGCGWGSLSLHAAEHFGAQVTGVTIAAEQKAYIDEQIRQRGLEDRVTIRLQDYREVVGRWDAVASIEMGEHVGEGNYPEYTRVLAGTVRRGGRVLVQQMSRRGRHPGGGPFIESFIAPDMHMRPVGRTVDLIEDAGLEVRDVHALREHYVWTVDAWMENFTTHREHLTDLVGEEVMRVWELYLVGGRMAFRDGRMGVDQILAVRPGEPHTLAPERGW
ncbi:SAM-dependent methyltransferase [Nocardioides jiangxiensis]|uniref:Cyclopropane-fatty-acyl-phospholipid synthase family protein n=1 Tax=Nocardioides jiangxiensis TaxID=3064524 RepID=A0ABT9AZZ1_9ACTN|nr:cyclopropane-fatty-acyl-phospholipid synthase family protein [Nocardioides sp. WY-20]MDO7868045.1 cyclopropane-fatty-acyl-phospholipid synthase family protein [Nocardioides sp. WY-20]